MVRFGFCFFVIFIFSCWFYVICKLLPFCLDSIFGNSSSLVVVPFLVYPQVSKPRIYLRIYWRGLIQMVVDELLHPAEMGLSAG